MINESFQYFPTLREIMNGIQDCFYQTQEEFRKTFVEY